MVSLTCELVVQCECCGHEPTLVRGDVATAVSAAAYVIRNGGHIKVRRRRQGVALMVFGLWWATGKPFRMPDALFLCRDAAELDQIGAAIVAAV